MIDVPKFYRIATKIAGDHGYDLVHDLYERLHDKMPEGTDEANAYFYRCLINEFYSKRKDRTISIELPNETESGGLDIDVVDSIITDLINEGYSNEVNLFIEAEVLSSQNEFSDISGLHRNTIKKIVTFVRSEIVQRYDRLHSGTNDNTLFGNSHIH